MECRRRSSALGPLPSWAGKAQTRLLPPIQLSLAFAVADPDDLRRVATLVGASGIESIDEPGGGRRVRLKDPDGHGVEVVYGIETVPALPVTRQALNLGANRLRNGEFQRPPRGASQVKRIGHGVLMTTDLHRMVAWYRDTLGLLVSDEVYAGRPDNLVGSFNRVDRGDTYVDHHVFFCVQGNKNGLNHLSFEVQDIDDVMIGHNHLKAKGYAHVWGIGRHQLGSHIFDYWAGPLGPRARALDRYRHAQRRFCAWALRNRRPQWTLGRSHPAVLSRACLELTATKDPLCHTSTGASVWRVPTCPGERDDHQDECCRCDRLCHLGISARAGRLCRLLGRCRPQARDGLGDAFSRQWFDACT